MEDDCGLYAILGVTVVALFSALSSHLPEETE